MVTIKNTTASDAVLYTIGRVYFTLQKGSQVRLFHY